MAINSVILNIDSQIYSKDIIFLSIDALSAEYIFLCKEAERKFKIVMRPRLGQTVTKERMESVFFDEVNNQIIRNMISSKMKNLRELIVGKALFETEAFDDDHSHFDINSYNREENYILDQHKIADTYFHNETK